MRKISFKLIKSNFKFWLDLTSDPNYILLSKYFCKCILFYWFLRIKSPGIKEGGWGKYIEFSTKLVKGWHHHTKTTPWRVVSNQSINTRGHQGSPGQSITHWFISFLGNISEDQIQIRNRLELLVNVLFNKSKGHQGQTDHNSLSRETGPSGEKLHTTERPNVQKRPETSRRI